MGPRCPKCTFSGKPLQNPSEKHILINFSDRTRKIFKFQKNSDSRPCSVGKTAFQERIFTTEHAKYSISFFCIFPQFCSKSALHDMA